MWIEIHILQADGESLAGGQIEVNLSLPPQEPTAIISFKPDIEEYSIPVTGAVFDENTALLRMHSQSLKERSQSVVVEDKIQADDPNAEQFNDEEVKMLGAAQA